MNKKSKEIDVIDTDIKIEKGMGKNIANLVKKQIINKLGKQQTVYYDPNKQFGSGKKSGIKKLGNLQSNYLDSNKRKKIGFIGYAHDAFTAKDENNNNNYTFDVYENNSLEHILKQKYFFNDKKRKNKQLTNYFKELLGDKNVESVQHWDNEDGTFSINIKSKNDLDISELSQNFQENIDGYIGLLNQTHNNQNEEDFYYHHETDYKHTLNKLMEFANGTIDADDPENIKVAMKSISGLRRQFGSMFVKRILQSKLIKEFQSDKKLQENYDSPLDYVNEAPFANMIAGWELSFSPLQKKMIRMSHKRKHAEFIKQMHQMHRR